MLKRIALLFTFMFASVVTVKVHAHVELNGFYASEALSSGGTTNNTRMFLEGALGFAIDKKAQYLVGWNYSMMNTNDSDSKTTTYSSTQMGPRFLVFFDKNKAWSVGAGYYLVTQASFSKAGGETEKWRGTALKFDFGYSFPLAEAVYAGVRFNYSSATYSEKIVGETGYSTVGYTKTAMYPSLYLSWIF